MIEEIQITGDCLEGIGIPNGGIAVIDREKVYENACAGCTRHGEKPGECYHDEPCERLISAFTVAEPVDAVEMKHGHWKEWWPGISVIMTGEEMLYCCSNCTAKYADIEDKRYCPNCGAKMDLEETT